MLVHQRVHGDTSFLRHTHLSHGKIPPLPGAASVSFSGHVCGLRYVRRSGPSTAVGNVSLLNGAWGGRHEAWSWVLEMGYHPETN